MSTEDVPLRTEWKQAEAEQRRLATIVVDSNDAVTVQDFEGQLTAWNRGAERMYGYSESEALSMNICDIVPEDRRDEALEFMQRIESGEDVRSWETQRISKDGRTLEVWLTVTKLVDDVGNPVAVATTERDITERKKAEKANARMSALVKSTSDAVVGLKLDGTITDWNTAANRIFGYPRGSDRPKRPHAVSSRPLAGISTHRRAAASRQNGGRLRDGVHPQRWTIKGCVLDCIVHQNARWPSGWGFGHHA